MNPKEFGPGGRYFAAEEKTHLPQPIKVFKTLSAHLGDEYSTYFNKYAEKDWIVYESERYTFKASWTLIQSVAQELVHGFGVKPGDTVGIAMRNVPEFMLAFVAIQCAGAVAVPFNSLWKTHEFEYAVKDSGCKVMFGDAERLRRCQPFARGLGLSTVLVRPSELDGGSQPEATTSWENVCKAGSSKPPVKFSKPIAADDASMIMYTSGSTGYPKGVIHTQRSLGTLLRLVDLGNAMAPQGDAMLLAVPHFHITAITVFARAVVCGAKIISMRKWDASVALNLIEREKVAGFTCVPTMMADILAHPTYAKERVASIKSLTAGGAPVPPSQVKATEEAVGQAATGQAYGLTEVIGACANTGEDYISHPKSCGKAVPFVEVVIKDPATGNVVPTDTRGEICIRSPMVMKGYHNQPDKTAEVMDSEGFFHSGDIGRMDADGFVYLMDRLKDVIIRGGENIDCAEVEAALYNHTSVRECSVFALPDERLGEVVGVAAWCTGAVKPEELSAKAAETLAAFKVPQPGHIFMLSEELPKGATGKIDKKGLRARFTEELTKKPPLSKL
jgi:acyl-CoA synthetase (AMP-forming)/AMP-acid ligase II